MRRVTSRAAPMAAADGSDGLISRATASGSSKCSRPSKPIRRVSVDLPDPFGPAIKVRAGTRSGRADFQLAYNFVVAPRRGPWYPADFESSPIRQFHDFQTVGIQIEYRVARRKRLMECGASGGSNGPIELFAVKVVDRQHRFIINPGSKLKIPHAIRQSVRAAAVRAALGSMVGRERHLPRPMGTGAPRVFTRHPAPKRNRIAPHGPHAATHGNRRDGPLASHARRYHTLASRYGQRGYRSE